MSSHAWPPSGGGSAYWGDAVATSGSLPASGAVTGECRLVLDTDDIYEWNGSAWERITQNSADVTGPGSSTDNAVARFDSTTGKIIQNSGVIIDDSNNVTGVNAITVTTNITGSALTASRAVVTDGSKILASATTTAAEIEHVAGVTSAIQTQLNAKLALAGGTMTGDIILAGDPDSALKAATKQYVDSVAAGLDVKPSVYVLAATDITLSGEQTIDGVLTSASRVLVRGQTATEENGIYVSAAGAWSRATDMDAWAEVPSSFVFVEVGTTYADTAWVCTADAGGTLGVTSITWSQFAGAGTYTADGQGIELSGTQYSLELDGSTLTKGASGLKVSTGGISNNEINSSAAIAFTKMANLTVSRALVSDGSGDVSVATTTATEIGYVNGVTSAIQTQLDSIRAVAGNVSISTDTTLTDRRLHLVDTSAARSEALPAVSATLYLVVKDVTGSAATNNITITTPGAETIDGAATYVINSNYASVTIVADGTNYFVI